MIIRFSIEVEKVLDALLDNYMLPDGLNPMDLMALKKEVYVVDANGDLIEDLLIEIVTEE
jgi:hypothetical protein